MRKASVILPCYKRIDQTLRTIEMLLSSSEINIEYNLEIIAVDSSLTNDLKNRLTQKFGEKIIYLKPNKPGIAVNKNFGARKARNSILIFCDSDMEVEPNTLIETFKSLERNTTAGAIGGQVIWKGGPKDKQNDRPRKEDKIMTVGETTYVEALYSRYFVTYKEIFWKVGGYDESVFNMRGEGSDLSVRYWRAGFPLVYDKNIKVHHVYNTEGGIIRGVPHPEWAIAKDLFLLAYKYDINSDKYENFVKTISANFEDQGRIGYYRIIEGLLKNYDFICKMKSILDKEKNKKVKPEYDFKFLEIFSEKEKFINCIEKANKRIINLVK